VVYTSLSVIRDAFLKEVGFSLQRDHIHKIERVCCIVFFSVAEGDEKPVGDEFDVLTHKGCVHPNQADW
jgi:hypothetical protein